MLPAHPTAHFRAHLVRRNRSPQTIKRYVWLVSRFEAGLSPRTLLEARPLDAADFTAGYAPKTEQWMLAGLATFYRFLSRHDLGPGNITAELERPATPHRLPRPIAPADLARSLARAGLGSRMHVILCLAAYAGLRCCEVAALRWDEVSPFSVFVREGKGRRQRLVPMHPDLLASLRAYGWGEVGPVVTRTRGKAARALGASYISQIGSDFLASLGIKATMHQLRHYFGTEAYAASRDLLLVRDLMGHKHASDTEGYTKIVVDDRARDAVALIGSRVP